MDVLRTEAEAMAIALEVGAASVDNVVTWARRVIVDLEHPHWSLCELALCSGKYPPDLACYLREIPGAADVKMARVLALRMLRDSLARHPEHADQVARALYDLALANEIDNTKVRELAWWAWDALDLADSGSIVETRDEIVARMRADLVEATLLEPS